MAGVQVIAIIAAACAGFAAGWICRTALERRQSYWLDYCRRRSPYRPGPYSNHPKGLPPPPPPPGTRREYLYSPATMAECCGPCFEAQDPRACDCGALWRDGVPWDVVTDPRFGVSWEEGRVQRGNGHGGPTTPKPPITPEPWQHQHLIRARGFDVPPDQPLTAQLIRYWRWQDEQVRQALEERQALKDDTNHHENHPHNEP